MAVGVFVTVGVEVSVGVFVIVGVAVGVGEGISPIPDKGIWVVGSSESSVVMVRNADLDPVDAGSKASNTSRVASEGKPVVEGLFVIRKSVLSVPVMSIPSPVNWSRPGPSFWISTAESLVGPSSTNWLPKSMEAGRASTSPK